MAIVPQIERSFSIQPYNAGTPGIRYRHPNVEIKQETADALSLDLLAKVEAASDAIWAVLHEEGVLEAFARLTHASLLDLVDQGMDDERGNASKALAAWPKSDDGSPSFTQHERAEFIDVLGHKLRDDSPQAPYRPQRRARQAKVTR